MPKVSIIILAFNSIEFIKSCLESLFAQDYNSFEVILIDNGSKDGVVNFIKERYPKIKLIENERNLGACKARNQGIEIAKGNWVLTLDCDIIFKKDFLKNIMRLTENLEESVGVIQPKILNKDKTTIYSCGIYLSKFLRRFYDIGKGSFDDGQFNTARYVFGACSAAALYRKQMLEDLKEKTGYFDERFFFLVEDVDLAWRAQKRGGKAVYHPEAVCYHYGNSSGYDKKFRQYLCFRNRYYSIIKNMGFRNYSVTVLPLLCYDLPRILYLAFTNPYIWKQRNAFLQKII